MRLNGFLVSMMILVVLTSFNGVDENDLRIAPFSPSSISAADSAFATLNDRQQIGQTILLQLPETLDSAALPWLHHKLKAGYLSGIVLPADISAVHVSLCNGLNDQWPITAAVVADLPAIIRYSRTTELPLPNPMYVASADQRQTALEYGHLVGSICNAIGVNMLRAGVLDLCNELSNAELIESCFSSKPETAAQMAIAFNEGLAQKGVMLIAGRFPGMGRTTRTSIRNTEVLTLSEMEMNSWELVPFKAYVNAGGMAICTGVIEVPALDSSFGISAHQSKQIVTDLLRNKMGFNGLTMSVAKNETGFASAIKAGNDLIALSVSPKADTSEWQVQLESINLPKATLLEPGQRIMMAKTWLARSSQQSSSSSMADAIKLRYLIEKGSVLLRNTNDALPYKRLDSTRLAAFIVSNEEQKVLKTMLGKYAPFEFFEADENSLEAAVEAFNNRRAFIDHVVIFIDAEEKTSRMRFGLSKHLQSVIERIGYRTASTLVWTGNPAAIGLIENIPRIDALITTYGTSEALQYILPQQLFGGRRFSGKSSVTISETITIGTGISTDICRLSFGYPEERGISAADLKRADEIALNGIREKAYPGCQVFYALEGMVIFEKAYGFHTYEEQRPVSTEDLYDIASITKIAASTAGLMKLTDMDAFTLDLSLCDYLPELVDTATGFQNMNLREMLAHQAGLPPYIPFYYSTLVKGVPRYDVYSLAKSDIYPYRVADNFYIHKDYRTKILTEILNSRVSNSHSYKYSDVAYYFAQQIIERVSESSLDAFVSDKFYRPLGLTTMTYKPLEKFPKSRITPTEYDMIFRNQQIHGDVHDPGAAMMGGVAGHAGLFSNARDLGVMMQLFLNDGSYGCESYLEAETLSDFIRCQFCENDNRRGAGFDKPLREKGNGPTCGCTDLEAFGHQGFTGTTTWADPMDQSVYVFLSNRIYPNANNRKLAELDIRTDIQEVFHSAVDKRDSVALRQ